MLEFLPSAVRTLMAFLVVLGVLIFFHELGHYLVGRWCGVKAEAFSIGFGPEIAAWVDKRGTRWRIAALPLGGYVKFKGDMNAASQTDPQWLEMSAQDRAESFPAKPLWQRAQNAVSRFNTGRVGIALVGEHHDAKILFRDKRHVATEPAGRTGFMYPRCFDRWRRRIHFFHR